MTMRRGVAFAAALALKQGNYPVALEIVSTAKNQNYTTIRNIKVACLVELGRMEEVFPLLKSVLAEDLASNAKHTFNREVLDRVRAAVDKSDDLEVKAQYDKLEKVFKEQGHVSDKVSRNRL